VSVQVEALAAAGSIILAAAAIERLRSHRARGRVLGTRGRAAGEPYILYFSGPGCTVCNMRQEPALEQFGDVRVERVDALAERELARRFSVYTVPTTVVMSAEGNPVHVNYGYAPASRLREQLGR
jgi:hypothetical protein